MNSEAISAQRKQHLEQWLSLQPGTELPSTTEHSLDVDSPSADELEIPKPEAFSQEPPQPGEIRLFSPEKAPLVGRPLFVATLGPWGEGLITTAPFSLWPSPALPGEFLLLGEQPSLHRVLCLWNTRNFPVWSFYDSWHVGHLSDENLRAVRKVFQSLFFGNPLAPALLARTGPESGDDDIKVLEAYFDQERAALAVLQSEALESINICEQLANLGEVPGSSFPLKEVEIPAVTGQDVFSNRDSAVLGISTDVFDKLVGNTFATAGSAKVLAGVGFLGKAEELIARIKTGKSLPSERLHSLAVKELTPLYLSSQKQQAMIGQWEILQASQHILQKLQGFLLLDRAKNWDIVGKGSVFEGVASLTAGDFPALLELAKDPSQAAFVFHQ